jgi:hypothetical protein
MSAEREPERMAPVALVRQRTIPLTVLRRTLVGGAVAAAISLGFATVAGADVMVVEGQSFAGQVVDVGCAQASGTIDWGDQTTSAGVSDGGTGVAGTHTYAAAGIYSASVTYTCPQFGTSSHNATFQATVQDAPLTGTGISITGTAGQGLSAVVAHFDDANPSAGAGDFSAQITWGDGTTTTGTMGNSTSGGFDVSGTHTYGTAGSFPLSATITDTGGSTTTTHSTAQIAAPTPPPPAPPPPAPPSRVTPGTIILTGPEGVTSDLDPQFVFASTAAGSSFQCLLDPGHRPRWTACATPHYTGKLATGKHLFEVRAISPAGVTDPTSAQRAFEVQPAASTEEHRCIKAAWDLPSLGAGFFGETGDMFCYFRLSCPEWYECALSGNLTFSFVMPTKQAAYIDVPLEVAASLAVDGNDRFAGSGPASFCVPPGEQYQQSGDTYYCSQAGQIMFQGRDPGGASVNIPAVYCFAGTDLQINVTPWFDSEIMGCDATVRRTWAPAVAHAHPSIVLGQRAGSVFVSSRAPVWTGFVASCVAPGKTCAANVTATLSRTARVGAALTQLGRTTPLQPPRVLQPQPRLVGSAALKIRAGKRARVTFSLTRDGAALLHKRHRLRVKLTITAPPARLRGRDQIISRTMTIVSPR